MDMPHMKFDPLNPEDETLLYPEENPEPEPLTHEQAAASHDLTVDDLQDIFHGRFYENLIETPGLQILAKEQAADLRRGLNFVLVTEAYQKARDVELLSKPAEHIAETTMRTYDLAVGALARASENGCRTEMTSTIAAITPRKHRLVMIVPRPRQQRWSRDFGPVVKL